MAEKKIASSNLEIIAYQAKGRNQRQKRNRLRDSYTENRT